MQRMVSLIKPAALSVNSFTDISQRVVPNSQAAACVADFFNDYLSEYLGLKIDSRSNDECEAKRQITSF